MINQDTGGFDPPEMSGLFPAHQVLPSSPLTIEDYRRLLLKIQGVRNAWLNPNPDPSQNTKIPEWEPPIYVDRQASELSYQVKNPAGNSNLRVPLSGLYRVFLELEIDDLLGSLNETRLVYQARRSDLKGVVVSMDCLEAPNPKGNLDFNGDFSITASIDEIDEGQLYVAEVSLLEKDGNQIFLDELKIQLSVVNDRISPNEDPLQVTSSKILDLLQDSLADGIVPLFWKKQLIRLHTLQQAICVLDAHRNLCEDYWRVETIQPEHVAICADIEVAGEADLEEIQAKIFHAIENYFNPPIPYYSLKEMLEAGYYVDEIFNGPYPDPAFTCDGQQVFSKPGL